MREVNIGFTVGADVTKIVNGKLVREFLYVPLEWRCEYKLKASATTDRLLAALFMRPEDALGGFFSFFEGGAAIHRDTLKVFRVKKTVTTEFEEMRPEEVEVPTSPWCDV